VTVWYVIPDAQNGGEGFAMFAHAPDGPKAAAVMVYNVNHDSGAPRPRFKRGQTAVAVGETTWVVFEVPSARRREPGAIPFSDMSRTDWVLE
jgi:hypothetical protein